MPLLYNESTDEYVQVEPIFEGPCPSGAPVDICIGDRQSAVKHTEGKPRFELISPEFMFGLADLLTEGAKGDKYAPRNWERGVGQPEYLEQLFGALQRHAWAWHSGEKVDVKPPFKHHMLGVAFAAMAIYTLEQRAAKNGQ